MTIRTATIRVLADVRGALGGVDALRRSLGDLRQDAAESASVAGDAWEAVGAGMLTVGVAAGAGLGVAVTKAADFEEAMSRVAAGTMASKKDLDNLRDAAVEMGASTQYSATEAADAITAMGKAGVSTTDILNGGLNGALALAAAGELEVAEAGEIAATAMTQFGLVGTDLPHVADLMAAGAGKAQGSVKDLAGALKYVGPVSKGMGVSIEETTGVLAQFASQGILGTQAGTGLRGIMMSLTAPSQVASKEMAKLGINVYNSSGQFVGLTGVAGQLQERLGSLTAAERDAAFGRIFGNEQITAARILYAGGAEDVKKWTTAVNDQGYAERNASLLTDNLKGDVERLGGALDAALISGGGQAVKSLRGIAQGTTSAIDSFNDAPEVVQRGVVQMTAFTAVVGVAGGSLLILVPKVMAANTAILTFTATTRFAGVGLAGVAKGAAAAAAGFIAVTAAGAGMDHALGVQAKGTNEAGASLLAYVKHGRNASDVTGLASRSFKDLNKTVDYGLRSGAWAGFKEFSADLSTLSIMPTGVDDANQFLKEVDAGLANLIESGHMEEAKSLFDDLAEAATEEGHTVDQLKDKLPAYQSAMDAVTASSTDGAEATVALTDSVEEISPVVADAKKKLETFSDALKGLKAQAFGAEAGADAFRSALNNLDDSVKRNGRSVKGNTDKAIANRDALRSAAGAALDALDAYASNGATTANVTKLASKYKKELYNQAIQAGFSKEAAKKYSSVLDRVPNEVKTVFSTPGMGAAQTKVKHLRDAILAIPNRKVSISVAVGTANKIEAMGAKAFSSGGPVYGPGTTTSDDIPAWLSDKEYVQTAYAHQKYGTSFMDAVNSGRFPAELAAGFARGGTPGVALQGATSGTVANALSAVAPALLAAARAVQAASVPSGGSQAGLVGLGNWFMRHGARVSEHQKFGGVGGGHVPGSAHYAKPMSRAIDVNFGPGGQNAAEMAFFDKMAPAVRSKGFKVLWRVPGHYNHLHAAFSKGGAVSRPRTPARRFATGGSVGADFSGISSIVSSRQSVSWDDVKRAQEQYREATQSVAAARRELAAAERAAAKATTKHQKESARRELAEERREYAAARRAQQVAKKDSGLTRRQFDYQHRPLSTRYHEAASTRNAVTAGFLKNVQILASRGYGNLARQLVEMGGSDAETLAAQAVRSTSVARRLQYDFGRSASLQGQLEAMPARLALTSALKTMKNPTLASISKATGISTSDIQAAALAMKSSLGGNRNARALMAGLGSNSNYIGANAGSGNTTNVTVQVAATTNPWLAGERAAAGAKRVLSVGPASRRF